MALDLRLFGRFDVDVDGTPLPPLRTRKGEWLLALLTLHGGAPVDRDWLAASLWPESLTEKALGSLRRSLTDLRAALGPACDRIEAPTPRTLRLQLRPEDHCDVSQFDAAIGGKTTAEMEFALALHRAPLLEGCHDSWAESEREARLAAYVRVLDILTTRARARGDGATAAVLLRRRIAADPLNETPYRTLMDVLSQAGDRAGAILVYRDLRARLHGEVGLEPTEETTARFRALRTGPMALRRGGDALVGPASARNGGETVALPSGVPRPLTALIGRRDEISALRALVAKTRLVTLLGTGGIGKTRLAIALAEALVATDAAEDTDAPPPPTVVAFVDLVDVTDPCLIAARTAEALGVRLTSPATDHELHAAVAVRSRAAPNGDILIILDNCEHLLPACAAFCESLLHACPELHLLTTSRSVLGVMGEVTWTVPPLPEADAVRLFAERARAARPGFTLGEEGRRTVAQICRRLDGIPLAVELAAVRARVLSPGQIAARLDDRFRLLIEGNRGAMPRHRTLRATLDWSHVLLAEPERVLLRRLAVFSGGATLGAIRAVCFPPDTVEWEVVDGLSSLADQSLLQVDVTCGADDDIPSVRYTLLETVRQYAAERLEEAGETAPTIAAHRRVYRALAEEAEDRFKRPEQVRWLDRLDVEQGNLRAALRSSLEAGPAAGPHGGRAPLSVESLQALIDGLHLAGASAQMWLARGYAAEGRTWLRRLLTVADAISPCMPDIRPAAALSEDADAGALHEAISKATHAAAILACRQADYDEAVALHTRNLRLREEIGDPAAIATTLCSLATVRSDQGDLAGARPLLERGLHILETLEDSRAVASALYNLATLLYRIGEADGAIDYPLVQSYYRRGLERFTQLGHPQGIAMSVFTLGLLQCEQEQYRRASPDLLRSVPLLRELGDLRLLAGLIEEFAGVAAAQSDWRACMRWVASARALRDAQGLPLHPQGLARQEQSIAEAKAFLSDADFRAAWDSGYALPHNAAIDEFLSAYGAG